MVTTQVIYCGDNLRKLEELPAGTVDLVYIDPPLENDVDFETLREADDRKPKWDSYNRIAQYVDQMRPLVVAIRNVLTERGSLYFHCDWRVEAYVCAMLDEIFGQNNFRSHIIWRRGAVRAKAFRTFQNTHDSIMFYSKTDEYTFNPQYVPRDVKHIESFYEYVEPGTDRRYRLVGLTAQSKDAPQLTYEFLGVTRTWRWSRERMQKAFESGRIVQAKAGVVPMLKRYFDEQEGVLVDNIWTDIIPIRSKSEERLGFSAQKPLGLLERVIRASTNEGDVVLDPFCGSGTALHAAQKLNRRWIGIDVSPTACQVAGRRLEKNFRLEQGKDFLIQVLHKSDKELREYSPLEFESWVINALHTMVSHGSQVVTQFAKRDTGFDVMIYPVTEGRETQEDTAQLGNIWIAVQVKRKDAVGGADVQAFKIALKRQNCRNGLFVAFGFTQVAKAEAQRALDDDGLHIKLLTITEILNQGDTLLP